MRLSRGQRDTTRFVTIACVAGNCFRMFSETFYYISIGWHAEFLWNFAQLEPIQCPFHQCMTRYSSLQLSYFPISIYGLDTLLPYTLYINLRHPVGLKLIIHLLVNAWHTEFLCLWKTDDTGLTTMVGDLPYYSLPVFPDIHIIKLRISTKYSSPIGCLECPGTICEIQ